ncbi:acyltransferase family protein [Novosphingobium sp. ERN07]|uniref:acyltransferase family protein n=1 Tax=Novosphingobium sp. ERN07 TaxID=2726187 RepID=UPI0014567E56|nr:acyltransferase family protein [Novosphingobium sp. ERN07]NLR71331.1 acyltransferase family protein [Novosphingobium sp. ERN07]
MATPAPRLHHLDAARALLLLLGLPFHVATKAIFESDPAAVDFQQSLLIGGWASVTHAFRMFAFFLLAGYFAGMIRERKGTRAWLDERVRRLGLPFLASLLTLGAVQFQLQDMVLHQPSPRFLGLPLALDHLWFLVVLLGFCATYAAIPFASMAPGEKTRRAMLLAGSESLVLLALLALWGLIRYAAEQVPPIPDAPIESLLWQQFLFHAAGFALGVIAWHARIGPQFFALRSRWIIPGIVLLLIPYLALDPLLRPALGKEIYPDLAGTLTLRAIELPLALLISLALFRLLAWAVKGPSRTITFFVDGALAIYLFHLLWAMLVLPQVRALPVPAEAQWLIASGAVMLLAVASYLIVRSNSITSVLFCGTTPTPSPTVSTHPSANAH